MTREESNNWFVKEFIFSTRQNEAFQRKKANEPKNIMCVNPSDVGLERYENRKNFIDSDELAKDWEYMIEWR